MRIKLPASFFLIIFLMGFLFSNISFSQKIVRDPALVKAIADFKIEDNKDPDKKDFSKLLEFFEKFTKENPDNQEGHYYLGYIYDRLAMKDGSEIPNVDIKMELQASDEFRKVIEINPDYRGEHHILSPYSRISSLWATLATKYILDGKTDSARWAFKKGKELGGFSESLLDYARSMMGSGEKDAIIFTLGDMVTFPMWYLQYMENYRRDITIVDLSLLNSEWYRIRILEKNDFGDNKVAISFSKEEAKMLQPVEWKTKTIMLPVPSEILSQYEITDKEVLNTGKIKWTISPTMKTGSLEGIRVQDIMVKDIIISNNWKRPVYFTTLMAEDNFLGLSGYLQYSGILKKLTPVFGSNDKVNIDTEATGISFLGKHNKGEGIYNTGIFWDGLFDKDYSFDKDVLFAPFNYRFVFFSYIYDLSEKKSPDLLTVLSRFEEKMPSDIIIPDYNSFLTLQAFYRYFILSNEFRVIENKIEKAVLEKLEKEEFTAVNFNSFITLAVIYREHYDYEKAEKILKTLKIQYPWEEEKINSQEKELNAKNKNK